ncbi:aspartate/glutamate racemase family protein [Devosia sp. A16]|uniref:aspartate/glutamate racemase family protein n=1 Tax=Devosia sp. A16 TaxID=1736675 RepID=UPI0006D7BF51|nr:aspartate/glutamate racemase family protein [Devosia sp. A16]
MTKPHILLINPNTSAPITETIRQLAMAEIGGQANLTAVTAPFGARYISSRMSVTIAAHAVLDAYAAAVANGGRFDAVIVACFGDPGIDALKEIVDIPVVGFADGGLIAAAALPGKFAIATIGEAWRDMLTELALRRGFGDRLAGVILIEENGRAPEVAGPRITARAKALGVERVVIGGTGLIPVLDSIAGNVGVDVVDPHRVTLHDVIRMIGDAPEPRPAAAAPSLFTGLSSALEGLLNHPYAS